MRHKASTWGYTLTENADEGGYTIQLQGNLSIETAAESLERLLSELQKKTRPLYFDLSGVTTLDDYGALVLFEIKHHLQIPDAQFHIINPFDSYRKTLALVNFDFEQRCSVMPGSRRGNFIVEIGADTIAAFSSVKFIVAFLGGIALAVAEVAKHPRRMRANDMITQMKSTGVDALPVIALISFLLGLIIAFMSSLQLKQFGAHIYVASLVAMAMVSELGPIMTAIVASGRTGSAFAAEIAAMKISEEVDALYVMGFDPTLFLVIPRMIASFITIPLLTVFANFFGIAGGLLIGIAMLDLTASAYISQTIETLTLFELGWGLMKSFVFALLVSGIGCLKGFQARGGAAAVGRAATSAVVASIFFIILTDSLFAVIRSYIG
ncbi:MAG TPA: ABC transporter permease [Desulfosalsimonadaceae bacterium]|nr:ABC transporter permease [Desulfosalsimonadaceae bacterium]